MELEATAALLDARYNQRVRGPPPPKLGFAPSLLSSLSNQSVPFHNTAGSDELNNRRKPEYRVNTGLTENSEIIENDNNGRLTPHESSKTSNNTAGKTSTHYLYMFENSSNSVKYKTISERRISRQNSVGADTNKIKPPPERHQTQNGRYPFSSNRKGKPQQASVLDYLESVKSVYPAYPSDMVNNLLPGLADLEDLGDDPLPPLPSQVTVIVDGCSSSPPHIVSVVRQARVMWPGVAVIVGLDEEKRGEVDDISHLSGVTLVTVGGHSHESLYVLLKCSPFNTILHHV